MADVESKIAVDADVAVDAAKRSAEPVDAVDGSNAAYVAEPAAKKPKLDEDNDGPVVKSEAEEIVSDATADASDLQKDIIQQIEYYFGDTNLFRDKFMLAEIEKNNGWVSGCLYLCEQCVPMRYISDGCGFFFINSIARFSNVLVFVCAFFPLINVVVFEFK